MLGYIVSSLSYMPVMFKADDLSLSTMNGVTGSMVERI
jgi:hypothetical protein